MTDEQKTALLVKAHDESIGDLQMIRSIDGFLRTREIVKLEQSVKIFWDRLRRRHNDIIKGELCGEQLSEHSSGSEHRSLSSASQSS